MRVRACVCVCIYACVCVCVRERLRVQVRVHVCVLLAVRRRWRAKAGCPADCVTGPVNPNAIKNLRGVVDAAVGRRRPATTVSYLLYRCSRLVHRIVQRSNGAAISNTRFYIETGIEIEDWTGSGIDDETRIMIVTDKRGAGGAQVSGSLAQPPDALLGETRLYRPNAATAQGSYRTQNGVSFSVGCVTPLRERRAASTTAQLWAHYSGRAEPRPHLAFPEPFLTYNSSSRPLFLSPSLLTIGRRPLTVDFELFEKFTLNKALPSFVRCRNKEGSVNCDLNSKKVRIVPTMGKEKHQPAEADVKVATVDLEAVDNMATLPVGQHRQQGSDIAIAEKHNTANKEMELKCVQPKPAKKTSLFIISSFIYAKLLVVVCIAYVISDVITHNLPLYYYEGFFTYLYGMSILFLLYVFCFLLQESACCSGGSPPKPKPPPKEKKPKKDKEKKTKDKDAKEGKDGKDGKKEGKKDGKSKEKDKDKDKDGGKEKATKESKKQSQFQEVYPRKMRDKVREQQLQMAQFYESEQQQDVVEMEAGTVTRPGRKRKTSQNDHSHGSFFLRIGAIAFGLGTMIYNGLEFGTFFELPVESPCYLILKGVNPVLQMVFTFMQMYFIFMNSRLNIHRFKVVARFGLMHVVATNICVWIRTLVLESLKEITDYHVKNPQGTPEESVFGKAIRRQTLRNSGKVFGAITTAATSVLSTVTTAKSAGQNVLESITTTPIPTTMPTTTTTLPPYRPGGAYLPQSKLLNSIKSTIGYDNEMGYGNHEYKDSWPNDNPFTTTTSSTVNPLIVAGEKFVTQAQTAMLEVFQWLTTTTFKPIMATMSTLVPSTTPSPFITTKDEWGE
ncbi:Proton channel OtopLc [Eumeta japonica]|uniref:Proton channel OtopLc n=1 Tax=Eumeta variegata TaxID=151549 RepID=A0A4C1ZSM4_EUMVA|nr:Proton channel OtopLc [Eumeta japonica]